MTSPAETWLVCQGSLAIDSATGRAFTPDELPPGAATFPLPGPYGDRLVVVPRLSLPVSAHWLSLRDCLKCLPEPLFARAGVAAQLADWWQSHQYCSACATPLVGPDAEHLAKREFLRRCPDCGAHYYPRINPCIIVLISRGDECLLALHQRSKHGIYTTLAGFVEPGETIEEAVYREVAEEVGVQVTALRYQYSQSWPFPGQLMLGFRAEYQSGQLTLQEDEITDAAWFHPSRLPKVPPKGTIARRLIDDFCEAHIRI